MNKRRPDLLIALGLLAGVLLLYAPARKYDFVDYDDPKYVAASPPGEQGLTLKNMRRSFHEWVAGNWHPLTMWSHLLDVELFGLHPAGHHLHSLLLHGLNAALLFLLLTRLTGARWPALAAAAMWAAHPMNTDSVVWIAERKNLLSTFFWLVTVGLYARYVRRPTPHALMAVILSFALALMAKPMPVTLPFTLLLLDLWPLRRVEGLGRATWPTWKGLIAEKVPLFVLSAVFLLATLKTQVLAGATEMGKPLSLGARLAWTPLFYLDYLRLFFWPARLSVLYPRPTAAPSMIPAAAAALVLVLLTRLFLGRIRRSPWCVVGWCWFLGTLVPVIGVVSLGLHSIADRYLYVPMLGLLMAVAWTGQALARGRARHVAVGSTMVAVAALCAATRAQLPRWRNSEALFRSAIETTQNNFVMHYNLGRQLILQNKYDEAIAHLYEAGRIHPDYALAHNNLGCALVLKGEPAKALPFLEKSLRIFPMVQTRINLARALLDLGRYAEAREQYALVLQEKPGDHEAQRGWRMAEHRLHFPRPRPPETPMSHETP